MTQPQHPNHPYRPSGCTQEELFETPPESRPFVDLAVTDNLGKWPIRWRRMLTGPTRWANLVIGKTIDCAARSGIEPWRIGAAMDAAAVVLDVTIEEAADDADNVQAEGDTPVRFYGRVAMEGLRLMVAAGDDTSMTELHFVQPERGSLYIPVRSQEVSGPGSNRIERVELPTPFTPDALTADSGQSLPPELSAINELHDLEGTVTTCHTSLVFSGAVTF